MRASFMRVPLLKGLSRRQRSHEASLRDLDYAAEVEHVTQRALLYFIVPLWLAAGLADWDRHRRTHIEDTSGAHESALHALMMTEAGIPAMLGLFLEVNAGVLLTAYAGLILHELTTIWDVAYAETRRRVTPTEQHIHSFLEVVPLMAVSFLTVLYWDQAQALVGIGPARADFRPRPKRRPLSAHYILGLMAALGTCVVAPYGEELWRCLRAKPTLAAQPEAAEPSNETLRISAEESARG